MTSLQLSIDDPRVQAALIAGAVSVLVTCLTLLASSLSPIVKYWFERKALKAKLEVEYEYEQRRKLRDLLSRYRGLLLEAAEALDHRCWNLYKNDPDRWLHVKGNYATSGYYFPTWLFRFLNLLAIARSFQQEALFIDEKIAEPQDFLFLHLVKAWSWAVCDVSLFDGIDYDHSTAKDHIFHDDLKRTCDLCLKGIRFTTHLEFDELIRDGKLDRICKFFDGLESSEDRLRWDRLVALHLLVMVFQASFGYNAGAKPEQLASVVARFKNPEVPSNLLRWLPKLGLEKHQEIQGLVTALRQYRKARASAVALN
jgi:hypothetical protein